MRQFEESAILITGCSSGIGRALVEEFSRRGSCVLATARSLAAIESLDGANVHPARLDVTDSASIGDAVALLLNWKGRVDMVVNNAGFGLVAPLAEVELDDLRSQIETNVVGLVAVTQAVVPHMVAQGSGRIVNIGSVSGVTTTPFGGPYSASKAAVHMVSDAMRMELAPFGIQVVTVQPGSVASAFGERASRGIDHYRKDSLYSGLSSQIEARAMASQVGAMKVDVFARLVADSGTGPHPPAVMRAGKNSFLLPFLARPPVRLRDRILSRKFGFGQQE